jgi:hypothetical protein
METRYIGLDVHREVLQACILDAQGRRLERHRFELTRPNLEAFIRERLRPQDRVVLEPRRRSKPTRSMPKCSPNCCAVTTCRASGNPMRPSAACGN